MNNNKNRMTVVYVIIVMAVILITAFVFQLYRSLPPVSITAPAQKAVKAAEGNGPELHYAIPVNALPTDNEIKEALKVRNDDRQAAEKKVAERIQLIKTMRAQIRSAQKEETTAQAENKQGATAQVRKIAPPASKPNSRQAGKELLQKIQTGQCLVH